MTNLAGTRLDHRRAEPWTFTTGAQSCLRDHSRTDHCALPQLWRARGDHNQGLTQVVNGDMATTGPRRLITSSTTRALRLSPVWFSMLVYDHAVNVGLVNGAIDTVLRSYVGSPVKNRR